MPNIRKKLFIIGCVSAVIALPQIMYMGGSSIETSFPHPGYLIDSLTPASFIHYWFFNLGLVSVLAPAGFLLTQKPQRKMFLPFLAFFVVGNLFQFSPEIAANHKFFNLFIIGANIFAAYFIYRLWTHHFWGKALAAVAIFFMTFSGIIDFFPIKNDVYTEIKDGKNNEVAQFIINNTSPKSTFINGSYIYDPASLAGRKIFLGWPYFSWSAGYNTNDRLGALKSILQSDNLNFACALLTQNHIDYLEIQNPTSLEEVKINYDFFKNHFTEIYFSKQANVHIYGVASACKKL